MKHLLFSRDGKHKVADGSVQRLTSRGFGRERDYLWHKSFAEMQVFPQGSPFLRCVGGWRTWNRWRQELRREAGAS